MWAFARHVYGLMGTRNLGLIAAGMAFYGLTGLFPGLAAVIALWGVLGDPGLVATEIAQFEILLPDEVELLLAAQLALLADADGLTLGWTSAVSLALAIWLARAGAAALMQGLNAIYDVPNRTGLAHYARAFLLTLALIGVALVALLSIVVTPVVLALVPLGGLTQVALNVGRWGVAVGVLLAGFGVIYRLGPNGDTWPVWPGAIFAVCFWTLASLAFSIYVANFGSYNEVYGSIGAVIAMLTWLYISAWLVLVGGALNAWLSRSD